MYTMEYYANIKENEIVPSVATQMDLEIIIPSEGSQKEKDKYHIISIICGIWNVKVGSQETPGVTGKFGLGVQKEAGQRLMEFRQKNSLDIAKSHFQQHKRQLYTWPSPDGEY